MDRTEFSELLSRVRKWDPEAVQTFLARFEPQVRREIRIRLTDPLILVAHSESDVCQSIVIDFLVRLRAGQYDFNNSDEVVRFLVTATTHKVRNVGRKERAARRTVRRRDPDADVQLAVPDREASPSSIVATRELFEQVLENLPPDDRYLAVQRGQGKTWKELAEELHEKEDTLRRRLQRSLDRVLMRLNPDNLEP